MSVSSKVEADRLLKEAETLKKAREIVEAAERTPASRATPLPAADTVAATARDHAAESRWGFDSFGHFLQVVKSCPAKNVMSEQLAKAYNALPETVKKSATGMGELIGSEGGFLVPPGFSSEIFQRVYDENGLLARTRKVPVSGNSMTFPRSAESSRADGSRWGGVRSYWVQEGSTITASQPSFGQFKLNLHKLATLVAVTSELKEDAPALDAYLNQVFASEIAFETGKALYRGNGSGRPLGVVNAPCAISVSKETGQAAATILPQNIVKMWSRRFALGPTGQYVWMINQDCGPQLHLLNVPIGTGGQMVYLPPGGLSSAPYGSLMGAPVMETEFNSTLGTVGDLALVDWSQYVTISKAGPKIDNSLHVYFTSDQEAVRSVWRIDGAPWQASAVTPYQGTNTQSPIVLLETRS
jgi:HK97 family phage major capsid protein